MKVGQGASVRSIRVALLICMRSLDERKDEQVVSGCVERKQYPHPPFLSLRGKRQLDSFDKITRLLLSLSLRCCTAGPYLVTLRLVRLRRLSRLS